MPLITVHGLHQLHIFIFFLAVFHVIYSAITMTLGRLKVHELFGFRCFFYKANVCNLCTVSLLIESLACRFEDGRNGNGKLSLNMNS